MTPLLLLPGMMCDARLWATQVGPLSRERAVMCAPVHGADAVPDLAARILAHAPPRFALAGLSMGGIVAMEMLARAPGRITHLALLDTNPLAEAEPVRRARLPQIESVRAGRLREVMRDEMKPRYLAPGPGRGAVLDLVLDMALRLGPEVFEEQSRALMSRADRTGALRDWSGPALVLCGRHDMLCPVPRHEMMAGLLGDAELEVVEEAGHLPTLEAPGRTTEALRRLLARQGA